MNFGMKYILRTLWIIPLMIAWIFPSIVDAKQKQIFQGRKYLDLTVGLEREVKLLHLPRGAKIKGTYKKVTSAEISKKTSKILFSPKREGNGTLTVHDRRGRLIQEFVITVSKSNLKKIAREIKTLLSEVEGIEVKIVNNKVLVDGEVLLARDYSRILEVTRQFPNQAASIVSLSPLAQKKIAEMIEREINLPEISVKSINGRIILEGIAPNKSEKDRAQRIAEVYVPSSFNEPAVQEGKFTKIEKNYIVNLITVLPAPPKKNPPPKMIQILLHYVQLKRDYTKGFKIQWTPGLSDQTQISYGKNTAGNIVSSLTGTISNLFPKLHWAKSHGHARVLRSGSLIVNNGGTGTLNSTMSVPYPSATVDGEQISQKPAQIGLAAKLKPTLHTGKSNGVQLELEFKMSEPLTSTSAGPVYSENLLNTAVFIRSGYSAAIGGLATTSQSTDYNRLPTNVTQNAIFTLFASKGQNRDRSQFVVFVTPIVKTSASEGSEKIKQKFRLRD